MKKIILFLLFIPVTLQAQNIHSKHFFHGYPKKIPYQNEIIIRDSYIISFNPITKFADWTAYLLTKESVKGGKYNRELKDEYFLYEELRLELDDYEKSYGCHRYDKGHMAPIRSFANGNWKDTNYLSNIVPQKSSLNRGIWSILERKERKFAEKVSNLYVLCGSLHLEDVPNLPLADEKHYIPSHYYKIIGFENDQVGIRVLGFIFPQNEDIGIEKKNSTIVVKTKVSKDLKEYLCTVDEIEYLACFNVLWKLYNDYEKFIESQIDFDAFNYFINEGKIK
ncbi:MAG: DNA/RNA non-specific endonuclease [Candidatus Hodarchaeota archaeon]